MSLEIYLFGGNDYAVGERTPGFPAEIERKLCTLLPDYCVFNGRELQPFLRFSKVMDGYVLSLITIRMDSRRSYFIYNYYFEQGLADNLLACSWVGLTQRLCEFIENKDIAVQQAQIQTYGWKDALGLQALDTIESNTIPKALICGGYLCTQREIQAKIRYTTPMEESVTDLLRLLPLALRRELSFSGPVIGAGQANGVKIYFCTAAEAAAMDNRGNEGGEQVDVIPCDDLNCLNNQKQSAKKLIEATKNGVGVSLSTWNCMLQMFPKDGTWENLFAILNDVSDLNGNFKPLCKKYGALTIAPLLRSARLVPDDVLASIYNEHRKLFQKDGALKDAYMDRFPQESIQYEYPSHNPYMESTQLDNAHPNGADAKQQCNASSHISDGFPADVPEPCVDNTSSNKHHKKKRTHAAQKAQVVKQLFLILSDLILAVVFAIGAYVTLQSPISVETLEQNVIITMETVHYIQHAGLSAILAFVGGVLFMKCIHDFKK